MDCADVQKDLGPYLDGELTATGRDAVECHLAGCSSCTERLVSFRRVAGLLADSTPSRAVPPGLWSAIEKKLEDEVETPSVRRVAPRALRLFGLPSAAAAGIILAVGLGMAAMGWLGSDAATAKADLIDFGVLLDALPLDANKAFRKFLLQYDAKETTVHAARQYAPDLNFDLPATLPGGFELQQVYTLRFGKRAGIAASYSRNGEFLATIFHPPVHQDDYGGHKDYSCVVGKHRGHKVQVGEWKLVHLTDPTTCHCVLSRLDEDAELPAVMAAVAPGSANTAHSEDHSNHE